MIQSFILDFCSSLSEFQNQFFRSISRAHQPGSHSKIGWTQFTDQIISLISEKNDGCVFLLWGNPAHQKEKQILNANKHKIIKAAHPSPLSFNKFFNSKCFSQANEYLKSIGKGEINWLLN